MTEAAAHREDAATRSPTRDGIVLASFLICTAALCTFPLHDTDFWWHLRTGELIWERGEVPQVDWYLFTDSDRPWIDLHWGFQLLVAGLYHAGGANLIVAFKVAVLTAAVAIGWHTAGRGLPAWLRAILWIPAIVCISGRGYERPEILSQLFLACWMWIALRVENQPKWIWALPAIQLLWINSHALFVLGLVVGACYAVDRIVRGVARGRWGLESPRMQPGARPLLGAGGLCAVAAFCSPYLEDGALFPLVLYRKFNVEQEFYASRIGEFQRPMEFIIQHGPAGLTNIYLLTEFLLAGLAILSVVLLAIQGRWSPFRLLLMGAFLHLAWEASRNVNIFAIVVTPLLVANIADLKRLWSADSVAEDSVPASSDKGRRQNRERRSALRNVAPAESPKDPADEEARTLRWNLGTAVWFGLWTLFVVTGLWNRVGREGKPFGFGERPGWFAHGAAKFAMQPGMPRHAIVAHMGQAAVYEYHAGPDRKVYMDPRLEVCTQRTFANFEDILHRMAVGDRSWESSLRDEEGRLPVIVLDSRYSRGAMNGMLQTRGWRLVFADEAARVFVEEPLAEKLALPQADFSPMLKPRMTW